MEKEPDGPYVCQPFGAITHPTYRDVRRLWGVGGIHILATVEGLTKAEAEIIVRALRNEENKNG